MANELPTRALRLAAVALSLLSISTTRASADESSYPDGVENSQDPKDVPTPPNEALAAIRLPDGFRATLFAAEPDVSQPVSLSFDDRGRLWVAECYTYKGSSGPWDSPVHDRILIFEDRDNDGRFDGRKVFTDKIQNLTSVLPGFGGVWATAAPRLVFIPDRDRDDVPDGPPKTLLDGWNDGGIGHCVVNGLNWGPDGWLYGNQGIQGVSNVGKPDASESDRRRFNGGIWRYHPLREVFEVVCEGTTNPWGLDFDDYGQAFFTNCVIGHLWHAIPGAHYERMYGNDFTPNTYRLIGPTSDHLHWGGGPWQESRNGDPRHDAAGGGHAHAGAMIYLGDNWPKEYRGSIFMNNIHGRRLNRDVLERRGSGYVARHGKDFLLSGDPWYRGIALRYGPDGGVYLSDWCDFGECHDNDGVHRKSGRIFKIVYGAEDPPSRSVDLAALSDSELVELQLHRNDWFVRHARRILAERASEGRDLSAAHAELRTMLSKNEDVTRRLRALWALYASSGIDDAALGKLLDDSNEHVRGWAIRLLADDRVLPESVLEKLTALARDDSSALVRLSLASAIGRIDPSLRWDVVAALIAHPEDSEDANLPYMIWYALEPLFEVDRTRAISLAAKAKLSFVRRSIARRAASR